MLFSIITYRALSDLHSSEVFLEHTAGVISDRPIEKVNILRGLFPVNTYNLLFRTSPKSKP
jgi:hypothetical protein